MKSILALLFAYYLTASVFSADKKEKEAERYYEKWLNQDVVYIITDEEKEVFRKLTTPEEKDRFIEQFWIRRDPNPATAENEFKEEHYRRLAYVNQHFGSGIPGWKTDRGRIYIKFGQPDEIDYHSGGGTYLRPIQEGGGATQTYPFEIWRYRRIEGIGEDVEFEFVDRSWSGEFKLAEKPEEKDMMLYVDGAGITLREYRGLASRLNRAAYQPGLANNPIYAAQHFLRAKDMPFERMRQYFATQRPPQIKFTDLKAMVETKIAYDQLPFNMRQDVLRLNSEQALVPITLEIQNEHLKFIQKMNIVNAKVNVYGMITGLNGRIFAEFEDTLNADYTQMNFPVAQKMKSVYQKLVALPPGLYKINLVVKDVYSGSIGTLETRLAVPRYEAGKLITSSLILARSLERIESLPSQPRQFVIGDIKVVPNVTNTFGPWSIIGVYLQAYNISLDQTTRQPSLKVEYQVIQDDKVIEKIEDLRGNSVAFFSSERVVLARGVPLRSLKPGDYKLRVLIQDNVSGATTSQEAAFKVVELKSTP